MAKMKGQLLRRKRVLLMIDLDEKKGRKQGLAYES